MVKVGGKPATERTATAYAAVCFGTPDAIRETHNNINKKGDLIGVARVAGIMAAKRTSELIPLCHPIAISQVAMTFKVKRGEEKSEMFETTPYGQIEITATVLCTGPTGVEMEALTAVNVAALTLYDMCKAVDKGMTIHARLDHKDGGTSGEWRGDRELMPTFGPKKSLKKTVRKKSLEKKRVEKGNIEKENLKKGNLKKENLEDDNLEEDNLGEDNLEEYNFEDDDLRREDLEERRS
jgi:cyclic pyranopterin phosphate synthase